MPFIFPTWGRPLGTREWVFLRRYPLSHVTCAVSFLPSPASPTSCDFSAFFSPTCCVSTKSAPRLCYYDSRLVGRSRMTAAVASSICFPRPCSRIFAASSPGGMSGVRSDRREIPSPSTPSLSNTSASPRRRDSFSTVSRLSVTEIPGGGVAVPIFPRCPGEAASWGRRPTCTAWRGRCRGTAPPSPP